MSTESPGNGSADQADGGFKSASALGLPVLAQLVAEALDGICVVNRERDIVYANVAACEAFGAPLHVLVGRGYSEFIAPWAWPAMLARFPDQFGANPMPATTTLLRPDGDEREVVYSPFLLTIGGEPHGGAVFRDVTRSRMATRTALALAQAGAQLAGSSPGDVLIGIARHAVATTRAAASGIVAVGDDHRLAYEVGVGPGYEADRNLTQSPVADWLAASALSGEDLVTKLTDGLVVIGDAPGNPVVLPDCRSRWESQAATRGLVASLQGFEWETAIWLPLSWQNRVFGLLGVYLPPGVTAPSEAELAGYIALADQASLAVVNARLADQARHTAALAERERLARNLHDSVSQALFSMTMHARAAEVLLARAGLSDQDELNSSIRALSDLARGSLDQMRALISELRPDAQAHRVG